jgi:hypothetical protein
MRGEQRSHLVHRQRIRLFPGRAGDPHELCHLPVQELPADSVLQRRTLGGVDVANRPCPNSPLTERPWSAARPISNYPDGLWPRGPSACSVDGRPFAV